MAARWWVCIVSVAGCGGVTTPSIGGGDQDGAADARPGDDGDASDGASPPADAAYAACMDANGNVSPSLKACASAADCAVEIEGVNCCGAIRYVGISKSAVSEFAACVAAWNAHVHFNLCDCAAGGAKTEDGKTVSNASGVHLQCTGAGLCMTSGS